MPNPTISVVLCNYNYGHYLEQCLAGILRQTFQDFEVVITDDGSTDNSREIIEKATNLDRRMRPVFSKKNRGVMATLEDVMQRATGSLIFSEATDDFIVEASFFDRAVKGMHAYPQAAGFFGTAGLLSVQTSKLIGMMGSATQEGYIAPYECYRAFLRGNMFAPGCSCIWRRDLLDAIGGYDSALGPQADFYVNHALSSLYGVVYDRTAMTCARVHEDKSNFGSKTTLWESARRLAMVEERMRQTIPSYEGMERDWLGWRARMMKDSINQTTPSELR